MNRAEVTSDCVTITSDVKGLGETLIPTPRGDFLCGDAQGLNIGTVTTDSLPDPRIVVMLFREQGGYAPRIGLMHQLTSEDARQVAEILIANADQIEADAARAAADAIEKARGK